MLAPGELGISGLCEIDPENKQHWSSFTAAMLICPYERIQGSLPFNPQKAERSQA